MDPLMCFPPAPSSTMLSPPAAPVSATPSSSNVTKAWNEMVNSDGVVTFTAFSRWYTDNVENRDKFKTPVTSKKRSMTAGAGVQTPAKKAHVTTLGATASPSVAPSAAGAGAAGAGAPIPKPLTAARRTVLLKALISSLKKSIKSKKFYNTGGTELCTGEAVLSPDEFRDIFGAVGTEVKSSNVVTQKELSSASVQSIFGALASKLTAQTYTRCYPGSFQKQRKCGSDDLELGSASVNFSKNTSICKIKFNVSNNGAEGGYGWW